MRYSHEDVGSALAFNGRSDFVVRICRGHVSLPFAAVATFERAQRLIPVIRVPRVVAIIVGAVGRIVHVELEALARA